MRIGMRMCEGVFAFDIQFCIQSASTVTNKHMNINETKTLWMFVFWEDR